MPCRLPHDPRNLTPIDRRGRPCSRSAGASGPVGQRWRTLVLALAACAAGGVAQAQPRYAVTPLGVLPGFAHCTPAGLNDAGEVVGACMPAIDDYFKQRGFIWRNGVMTALGTMKKGTYSVATAINASGVVVGGGDSGNFRPQGWVRRSATLDEFFANNGGNTHTVFIANAGWIGGYTVNGFTNSPWQAAVWTPDPKDARKYRQTLLPQLPGGSPGSYAESIATGFNQAGLAVGYVANDQVMQRAVLWLNNAGRTVVDLGTYPGDVASSANGINDLGQVVGVSYAGAYNRALLWGNDAARRPTVLPPLAGDNGASAQAINNLGQVLGWSYQHKVDGTPMPAPRAVVWREGQAWPLQALLAPATGTDWQITDLTAINHRGQIVGRATRAGLRHAVLLTPLN